METFRKHSFGTAGRVAPAARTAAVWYSGAIGSMAAIPAPALSAMQRRRAVFGLRIIGESDREHLTAFRATKCVTVLVCGSHRVGKTAAIDAFIAVTTPPPSLPSSPLGASHLLFVNAPFSDHRPPFCHPNPIASHETQNNPYV
jgi:hypothetical protein